MTQTSSEGNVFAELMGIRAICFFMCPLMQLKAPHVIPRNSNMRQIIIGHVKMLNQDFVIKKSQVAQSLLVPNKCSCYWAQLSQESLWLRAWCWSFMGLPGREDMGLWCLLGVLGNCHVRHSSVREEARTLLGICDLHRLALKRVLQAVFYFWSFPELVRKSLALGLYLVTVNAWSFIFDV